MISTIHDSTMVDVPWRNEEVLKKPICIFQYNMFMKGVDRADQYLNLSKTKPYIKNEIQRISATSGKDWATDKVETDTDAARPGTSTQTHCVPHEDPPGRLSGDMRKRARKNCWK